MRPIRRITLMFNKRRIAGKYVQMIYVLRALHKINNLKLGDSVQFEGKWFVAIQGVADPIWTIFSPDGVSMQVDKSLLRQQPLYKRFRQSFMHTYRFYMNSWYSIDVNNVVNGGPITVI